MPIKRQPRKNGQILRKVQSSKTKPRRNRKDEQTIASTEIETVMKKFPTNKIQDQMASQANSAKNLERS